MRIETKFTPGQKVWGIYNNKVQEFLVETVEATSNFNYDTNGPYTPFCKYKLRIEESAGYRLEVYESDLEKNYAPSKEELLKSL